MGLALEAAQEGLAAGEVPVGAAGEILTLARAVNRPMALSDPTAPTDNLVQVLVAGIRRTGNIIKL